MKELPSPLRLSLTRRPFLSQYLFLIHWRMEGTISSWFAHVTGDGTWLSSLMFGFPFGAPVLKDPRRDSETDQTSYFSRKEKGFSPQKIRNCSSSRLALAKECMEITPTLTIIILVDRGDSGGRFRPKLGKLLWKSNSFLLLFGYLLLPGKRSHCCPADSFSSPFLLLSVP